MLPNSALSNHVFPNPELPNHVLPNNAYASKNCLSFQIMYFQILPMLPKTAYASK